MYEILTMHEILTQRIINLVFQTGRVTLTNLKRKLEIIKSKTAGADDDTEGNLETNLSRDVKTKKRYSKKIHHPVPYVLEKFLWMFLTFSRFISVTHIADYTKIQKLGPQRNRMSRVHRNENLTIVNNLQGLCRNITYSYFYMS